MKCLVRFVSSAPKRLARRFGNGPLHERVAWIFWSKMNIDARCERSPVNGHVHEFEDDGGECMGLPINRKIFMAV